jgi:hypothetical protein
MAERKAWPTQDGVLYAKSPIRKVNGKDGKEYEFQSVILEIDESFQTKEGNYIKKTIFMEFDLSKNAKSMIDSFNIKDPVTVTYTMAGRQFKKKDGTMGYDNKLSAYKIEFSDLDAQHSRPQQHKSEKPKPEPVLIPEEDDDLPF